MREDFEGGNPAPLLCSGETCSLTQLWDNNIECHQRKQVEQETQYLAGCSSSDIPQTHNSKTIPFKIL